MRNRWLTAIVLLAIALFFSLGVACGGSGDDDDGDDDSGSDDDSNDDDDGGDDDSGGGDFTATLVTNPACVISCVVSWTTSDPATSWVRFGPAGSDYELKIGSDDLVTDHEVVVVGMHAQASYDLRAVSVTEGGDESRSQEMSFTAGSLPSQWLEGVLDVYEEGQTEDGWTIMNVAGATMQNTLAAAMYDMDGETVWYYMPSDKSARVDTEVHWVEDGYATVGPSVAKGDRPFAVDLQGNILWEGPVETGDGMNEDGAMHHVFHRLDDDTFVTTFADVRQFFVGDEVVVFDRDLDTVWSWNFWDYLSPRAATAGDWTHVNCVVVDLDGEYAYINSYGLSTLFKIDMNTGAIVWELGQSGDFDEDPDVTYPWFNYQHGVDVLSDNRFLFYDNGTAGRGYSRAVMYQLDTDAMTSTIVWEYHGENAADRWYNMSVGDADELDNGNILITAGNGAQAQSASRIIEVTPDGEKVWQFWLQDRTATYAADRMPALAQPID